MEEKRGITPLDDKQKEEYTSGHKKNPEEAKSWEDVPGFGAQGLPLLSHCPFWAFMLLFGWLLFLSEKGSHTVQG